MAEEEPIRPRKICRNFEKTLNISVIPTCIGESDEQNFGKIKLLVVFLMLNERKFRLFRVFYVENLLLGCD